MRVARTLPARVTAGRPRLARPAFDPANAPTLVAQWDASAPLTLAATGEHPQGGGDVTGWTDRIGGRVLSPAASDTRPEYTHDAGRRTVFFHNQNTNPDTVADYLTTSTSTSALTTLPITIFLACGRLRQGGYFDRVLHIGSSDINHGVTFSFNSATEAMRVFIGTGVASTNLAAGTGDASGSVYTVACASSGCQTWTDGTAGGTTANAPSFGGSALLAAGLVPGNISFNGPMFEILVYSGTSSEDDRQRIEGYLAHKWGTASLLPASHPWRFNAP